MLFWYVHRAHKYYMWRVRYRLKNLITVDRCVNRAVSCKVLKNDLVQIDIHPTIILVE